MALTRPALIRPFADSGFKVTPADGAMNTGLASVARIGYGTFNFLTNYAMQGVRYLARRGIADWISGESYVSGDIQNDGGILYQLTGTPSGAAPHLDPSWVSLLPPMPPQFGTGADGVHTVTGSEQLLLQAKNYSTLTVNSGGVLQSLNSILRCQTLWVKSGGKIHCDGNPGVTADLVGASGNDCARPNYASDMRNPWNFAPLIGGGMGGLWVNGTQPQRLDWQNAGASDQVTVFDSRIFQSIGTGHAVGTVEPGAGGSADGGVGGGAGAGAVGPASVGSKLPGGIAGPSFCADEALSWLSTPGFYSARLAGGTPAWQSVADADEITDILPWLFMWHGGAGGSQGVVSGGTAGMPGAGGGIVCIFAYNLRIDDLNAITALGGPGSNAIGGNCGGGGGGAGGRVVIFYRNFVGTTPTAACVNGGAAGISTGSASAPVAGGQGKLLFVRI